MDSVVTDDPVASLSRSRYLSLTTYRRDGRRVPTPVWFAVEGDRIYVWTEAGSGKVKRIRNRPEVTVAVCNAWGGVKGDVHRATARVLPSEERERMRRLIAKKYGLQFQGVEAW